MRFGASLFALGNTRVAFAGFVALLSGIVSVFAWSVFSGGFASAEAKSEVIAEAAPSGNLQTMAALRPAMNIDPSAGSGGGDITIVDGSAVEPQEGPAGTIADIVKPKNAAISLYIVREGDTLSEIAEMFEVSVNTIRWANDIPTRDTIRPGQTLTILPITGVKYTVEKGDTLSSIAKDLHGDADEIARFNGIEEGSALSVGTEIIIPNGEVEMAVAYTPPSRSASSGSGASGAARVSAGYYVRPISGGIKTQGIHGYNAVDLAAPAGTPIVASAAGKVIVSRNSGWNGGYGKYIVIQHANGTQTLYSHNSSNIVSVGQKVVQGQVIGYIGSTGRSTGPHVHFEIRGGIRNPF